MGQALATRETSRARRERSEVPACTLSVEHVERLKQAMVDQRWDGAQQKLQWYEFLISPQVETPPSREGIEKTDFLEVNYAVLEQWVDNMLAHKERVGSKRSFLKNSPLFQGLQAFQAVLKNRSIPREQKKSEIHKWFQANAWLGQFSPIHFQGALDGQLSAPFTHINTERLMAYEHDMPNDLSMRMYCNPHPKHLAKVVSAVIAFSTEQGLPFRLKFVDYSSPATSTDAGFRKGWERMDQMLVYADPETMQQLSKFMKQYAADNPEYFQGREVPQLLGVVSEGFGVGAEVTQEQNEAMKKKFPLEYVDGSSFNSLRSEFLREASCNAMKAILLSDVTRDVPIEGRTVFERFTDYLYNALERNLKKGVTKEKLARMLLSVHFNTEHASFKALLDRPNWLVRVDDALESTCFDIFPIINSQQLRERLMREMRKIAPSYGLDADNLAMNGPRVAA